MDTQKLKLASFERPEYLTPFAAALAPSRGISDAIPEVVDARMMSDGIRLRDTSAIVVSHPNRIGFVSHASTPSRSPPATPLSTSSSTPGRQLGLAPHSPPPFIPKQPSRSGHTSPTFIYRKRCANRIRSAQRRQQIFLQFRPLASEDTRLHTGALDLVVDYKRFCAPTERLHFFMPRSTAAYRPSRRSNFGRKPRRFSAILFPRRCLFRILAAYDRRIARRCSALAARRH